MASLMLINPRKRGGAKRKTHRSAAQKAATRKLVALNKSRHARKANPSKRRTYHHHAGATATVHRRRRSHRRSNPINLRNPMAMLVPALKGAAGALVVNALVNYIPLPQSVTQGRVRYATKAGIAILLGTFGRKFIGNTAVQMAEGSLVVTFADLLKDLVGGTTGLNLGDSDGIAYISPAQMAEYVSGDGVGMYLAGDGVVNQATDNGIAGMSVFNDSYNYR